MPMSLFKNNKNRNKVVNPYCSLGWLLIITIFQKCAKLIKQSGIVISFDNLDQNKSLTNRCASFRSRDTFGSNSNSIWRSTGAAIKGVTIFTSSPSSYIDLILCLLHNRLLDCGIETDLWKKTVSVQK